MTYIELVASDGAVYPVTKDEIACSKYLSSFSSGISVITTIRLPEQVPAKVTQALVHFMKMSAGPTAENWISEFINENISDIGPLFEASFFLEIEQLTNYIINMLSKQIKGAKTIQELRNVCGITNDFTEEEESDVIAQVSWAIGDKKATPF